MIDPLKVISRKGSQVIEQLDENIRYLHSRLVMIPAWSWPAPLHGDGDDAGDDQHHSGKGRPGKTLTEERRARCG